ncbi:rare lipoprotein A [Nitrosovibrio sp. Nv17]|nr:rare lipoprotein A [Nitrosovibrio sp. Nv17]
MLFAVETKHMSCYRLCGVAVMVIFLAGCGSFLKRDGSGRTPSAAPVKSGTAAKKGGYYLDDGPGDDPPGDLASIPDAVPRAEPLRAANMRPYVALGKSYTPMTTLDPYRERGIASWYGRRYHGQKTASGEVYDMYAMTAAHPTLPLPSYARITHLDSGRSVIVRVNDRGPFHSDRLIDLSYTAAFKLGVLDGGSGWVEVESILPGAESPAAAATTTSASPPQDAPPVQNRAGTADAATTNMPALPDTGGIYLQLGAFAAYDNADSFLAHMRTELPALSHVLGIVPRDGLFKVHAGPFPDHAAARQAADGIARTLSIRPMLLVR